MIREVRDTLYDLRTDVSDEQDLAPTLEAFASPGRASAAASPIELHCDRDIRLPLLQEREMWRIAQEALTNVERHAEATRSGSCGAATADPPPSRCRTTATGFPSGTAGRLDSYGILGMRERASSIGATARGGLRSPARAPGFAASSNRGTDMSMPNAHRARPAYSPRRQPGAP